jgi:hypothetical protein
MTLTTMGLAATGQALAACDPHYRGQTFVPIASDVDCSPGNGNGPEYVTGPFEYEGEDIYDLDRDGDGVTCEPPPR